MRTKLLTIAALALISVGARAQQPPASHTAKLTWTYTNGSSDPATGFNVYRIVKGSSGSWTLLTSTPLLVSTLTYSDTTVATGVDYLYYVTAVDAQGNQSNPSNTWDSGAVPGPLGIGNTLTGTIQ